MSLSLKNTGNYNNYLFWEGRGTSFLSRKLTLHFLMATKLQFQALGPVQNLCGERRRATSKHQTYLANQLPTASASRGQSSTKSVSD